MHTGDAWRQCRCCPWMSFLSSRPMNGRSLSWNFSTDTKRLRQTIWEKCMSEYYKNATCDMEAMHAWVLKRKPHASIKPEKTRKPKARRAANLQADELLKTGTGCRKPKKWLIHLIGCDEQENKSG
jgi:hypothetical protein